MKYEDLRPVRVHAGKPYAFSDFAVPPGGYGGLFHTWGGTSEDAYAIIELQDGQVIKARVGAFRFTDQVLNTAWSGVAK